MLCDRVPHLCDLTCFVLAHGLFLCECLCGHAWCYCPLYGLGMLGNIAAIRVSTLCV
ncbi:hypothetical protein Leryth_019915, partial [Lithospermum erythrorhizon]